MEKVETTRKEKADFGFSRPSQQAAAAGKVSKNFRMRLTLEGGGNGGKGGGEVGSRKDKNFPLQGKGR